MKFADGKRRESESESGLSEWNRSVLAKRAYYEPYERFRDLPERCKQDPAVGCCHNHAYYYDSTYKECRGFWTDESRLYGSEEDNRFNSRSECQDTCMRKY